jgi:biopolymer transport protein ExbD
MEPPRPLRDLGNLCGLDRLQAHPKRPLGQVPRDVRVFANRDVTMPLKTDGIDEPELNLTPMIDIVFLLIIFFLVGTEFAEDKSVDDHSTLLPIELPTSSTNSSITPGPDPVVVSITKQGELFLNTKPVNMQELEQDLIEAKKNYADTAVIIAGDGQSYLQIVVNVLQVCQRLEIKQARIKTTKVEATQP